MFRDTERLIEGCIQRDDKAWETFIERFSGLLYFSATRRLRAGGFAFGQHDLEDIVQTVFLELLQNERLREVKDRKKIKAYLSIIAQTRALNYMRAKRERLLHEEEFDAVNRIASQEGSMVFNKDIESTLEDIIMDLDPKQKLVLKMRLLYKKTHKEIAQFMDIPVNTVSSIIARKKKILREKLKGMQDF